LVGNQTGQVDDPVLLTLILKLLVFNAGALIPSLLLVASPSSALAVRV